MQVPFQIRFHNMAASEAIETRVRERVARLERFSDGIISCRVTVEAPHKQPHRSTVGITVDIGVRGQRDRDQARVPPPRIARRCLSGDRRRFRRRGAPAGRARAHAAARGQDPRRPDLRARGPPVPGAGLRLHRDAGPPQRLLPPHRGRRTTLSTTSRSAARSCTRWPRTRARWGRRRAGYACCAAAIRCVSGSNQTERRSLRRRSRQGVGAFALIVRGRAMSRPGAFDRRVADATSLEQTRGFRSSGSNPGGSPARPCRRRRGPGPPGGRAG